MRVIRAGANSPPVLRLINESSSSEEVAEHLKGANLGAEAEAALAAVVAGKRQGKGVIRSEQELAAAVSGPALERLAR